MAYTTLAPRLYSHIRNKSWSSVVTRLSSHPEEAKYTTTTVNTMLHCACCHDPPVKAITALLLAYPEAMLTHNMLVGLTPLHIASVCSSDEVVMRLLQESEGIIACGIRDKRNRTPLLLLSWKYRDEIEEEVAILNKQQDDASTEDIPTGSMARHLFLNDDARSGEEMYRIWKNACLLVKVAYHGTTQDPLPNGYPFRLIHAFAGIGRENDSNNASLLHNLLRLAIKFHPEQLMEQDENGNLPLHIASAAPNSTLSSSIAPLLSRDEEENKDDYFCYESTIQLILKAYPKSSRKRNHQSNLPLHIIVASGKQWEHGVSDILRSFPHALHCQDSTGLYPFMLAAAATHVHDDDDATNKKTTSSSLDVIYNLFRACPELERYSSHFQMTGLDTVEKLRKRKRGQANTTIKSIRDYMPSLFQMTTRSMMQSRRVRTRSVTKKRRRTCSPSIS